MNYPNDYLAAISEFEALDEDHKEPYLYAFLGYVVYQSQHLEKLLMNIIWGHKIVNRKDETSQELNEFLDGYEFGKHTMGALVKEVGRILNLPKDETAKVDDVLRLRNYIVHNYFKVNPNLMYAPDGYKLIVKDFLNFINNANELESMLETYLYEYIEKLGFSRETIELEIKAEAKKWASTQVGEDYQGIRL